MCPDRQIISLYLDGELPSPWKEKMAAHLESCPECQANLAGFRRLSLNLEDLPGEKIQAAQERVWKKLTAPALVITGKFGEGKAETPSSGSTEKRIWNRSITLPLPVAAAAAALIIFASVFIPAAGRVSPQSLPLDAVAATNIVNNEEVVPMQDMSEVLKYLSSQDDGGDIMIIRLPESRNFSRSGEPALINAADYSSIRNSR